MSHLKKIIPGLCVAVFLVAAATAQTVYVPSGTSGIGSSSNGNVGVGLSAPGAKFEVIGETRVDGSGANAAFFSTVSDNTGTNGTILETTYYGSGGYGPLKIKTGGSERLRIDSAGNVGIGTTSPAQKLDVNGLLALSGYVFAGFDAGTNNMNVLSGSNAFNVYNNSGTTALLTVLTGGSVGIGTTSPGSYKLAVNGTVRAKEVVVDTGWSDYVFKPDYHLASLSEVEGAIQRDGHLPGIPSAAEVAAHGVSMGDMQSKLLAKVEELTLHLIAQEKSLTELKQENAGLKAQLREVVETIKLKP